MKQYENNWSLKGFDAFSRGIFENAGQNLYVSKNGVLQRIWRYDVNNDGFVDLPVANSHDFNEHPSVHIISDPSGTPMRQEVLTQGAQCGAIADINGDGYDDLIIGSTDDGHTKDLASYVYFGGPDGITENRKIDLAASVCECCAVGDFNGDGKKEICYLISDCPDRYDPLTNRRLRVYRQAEGGFRMNDYTDLLAEIAYFTSGDIDGDGCDDLYCRTMDGRWLVLWGSPDGFSLACSTEIGTATDDQRFNILPFGGGNVGYREIARSKILQLRGIPHLFFSDAQQVQLIPFEGRMPGKNIRVIPVPNVISAGSGCIYGSDDLVLLQINSVKDQHVLVYAGSEDYCAPVDRLPTMTPRDVLLYDFSSTGKDDIVVVQGRNMTAFTTESLLYITDSQGNIHPNPKRFETHNCVQAFAANFNKAEKKSLVFVNQQQSTAYGHIPVYIYLGSEDGYKPENRLEFPGHSAGTILTADFNDDGWPDIMVMHNAEDQPFLKPPADLYWGGPDGFSESRKTEVYSPLAWGGHCADLNKDGYLDLVSSCTDKLCIQYGGPQGIDESTLVVIDPVEGEPSGSRAGALWPALADLNGDGWLDLVLPISYQNYSRIYWGGPNGFSNERSTKLPVECGVTVRIADLNKDGYPDIIFGTRASYERNRFHEGSIVIFWGSQDGYSGYNCCVLPCYEVGDLSIADLNNDGWLDIFVSTYFNKRERDINSFVYWNDHGSFSLTNRKRFFAHSSSGCLAGDFNEDGYIDMFVTNHRAYGDHRTDSAIWWNGPNGFTEENRTWLPTIGPHDLTPNDIGNVMTRSPEEFYISPCGCTNDLRSVGWIGEIPAKTWVNCQIRTAKSASELESAPFIGIDGTPASRFENETPIPQKLIAGSYFQVKLYLGAVNSGNTPRITEIYTN